MLRMLATIYLPFMQAEHQTETSMGLGEDRLDREKKMPAQTRGTDANR